jgi:predicted small secreted protein
MRGVRKSRLSFLAVDSDVLWALADSDQSRLTDSRQRNKAVFQINYCVTHEVNMFGRCVGMLLLAGALLSLTGCNTVAGFGQDISGASRSVQRAL